MPSGFLGQLLDRVRGPNYDKLMSDMEDEGDDAVSASSNREPPSSSEVQEADEESTLKVRLVLPERDTPRTVPSHNGPSVSEDAPVRPVSPSSTRRMQRRPRSLLQPGGRKPVPARVPDAPLPSAPLRALDPPPLPSLGSPTTPLPMTARVPQPAARESAPAPVPVLVPKPQMDKPVVRRPDPVPVQEPKRESRPDPELDLDFESEQPLPPDLEPAPDDMDDELSFEGFDQPRRWRSPISFGGNVVPTLVMTAGIVFLVLSQSAMGLGIFNTLSTWWQPTESAPVVRNCAEVVAPPPANAATEPSPMPAVQQASMAGSMPIGKGTKPSVATQQRQLSAPPNSASMAAQSRHPGRNN